MSSARDQATAFREALAQGNSGCLARLSDVTEQLLYLHRETAELQAAERRTKTEAWFAANETSVTARDRVADISALDTTTEAMKVRAEIVALTEERDHLRLIVAEYGRQ